MKKKYFFIILLFLFSFSLLISCNSAQSAFNDGSYNKALEILAKKKVLKKNDHLVKIKCLYNLARADEAKESTLLYLLMSNDSDERQLPVQLYCDMDFSDSLNIQVLKPSDGFTASVKLFKSYFNLGLNEQAKTILTENLVSYLNLSQFIQVLIEYPVDNEYTLNVFHSWYEIIYEDEIPSYLDLLNEFVNSSISDELAVKCLDFVSMLENSDNFKSKNIYSAKLMKFKGDLCYKLHDYTNGKMFYQNSYKLNPRDTEVKNKLK